MTEVDDFPDTAAAELALGLLDGDERAAALRRVLAEPGFAHAVERWRTALAQLFDLWPAVEPPDHLLARVERSIDLPDLPQQRPAVPGGRLWPALALLASIAAVLLFVIVIRRPDQPAVVAPQARTAPMLVASIAPLAAGAPVTALYDPRSGALRLTKAALAVPGGSAELWVIEADGVPHGLGLMTEDRPTAIMIAPGDRARVGNGATLAVSREPAGGSPTGLPTGPVVAKGQLVRV